MTLTERARVALKGEWMPGMRETEGRRVSWTSGYPGGIKDGDGRVRPANKPLFYDACPDLTDEPTVLALAAVCRRRLDACDADHGVTSSRREALGAALSDWACGSLTLADLGERVVYVMELIE